ncbi:MAG: hypothetical protein FWH53_02375 [Leptospirales bacterium]|nr:hypothetical protein [Leptospirales bacterium]
MDDSQKQEKITLESLYAYLHESEKKSNREFEQMREEAKKRSEEFDKRSAERDREFTQMSEEWQKIREKSDEEWQKIKEKSDEQWQKIKEKSDEEWQKIREEEQKRSEESDRRRAEIERLMDKNARTIDEINKALGTIGNNNGDFAEEYFQSAFKKNPQLNGETYNKVITNMQPAGYDDEYDIFLSNDKSVAIIEIKYSVRTDDIGKLLQKAENFRKFLPKYNNQKLYLGIASLSFRKITEKNVLEKGIAVIKQVGDKMVVHDKNLKVF